MSWKGAMGVSLFPNMGQPMALIGVHFVVTMELINPLE